MKNAGLIFITLLLHHIISFAQSDGPNVPTTFTSSGTGAQWGNLVGVVAIDNSPAYADLAQFPTCNSFMCYYSDVANIRGFYFNVPSTSIITGISLEIMQRVSSPGGGIHDSSLVLSVGGIVYGSDHKNDSNWFDTPAIRVYGGPNDTWGYVWTPQEINDSAFGVLYRLTNSSYDQPGSVDYMTMTVYYQAGNGILSQTSSNLKIGIFKNMLLVSGSLKNNNENCEMEISDILGKTIFRKKIESKNNVIHAETDVSLLSKGIYIVRVINGASMITKKIVIDK